MKSKYLVSFILSLILCLSITAITFAADFSDNFESGSYSNWTTQYGSWSVVTDGSYVFYQSSTSSEGRAWLNTSTTWTDQTVQAKVKVTSFNSSNPVLVCARMIDGNNYYAVAVKSGTLELRKKVSGSTTVLASTSYTFSAGTWYTIKISVVGSTLTAYVNGAQKLSTTASGRTSGKAGLIGWKTAVKFDDVYVTSGTTITTPTPTTSSATPTPTPTTSSATPTPTPTTGSGGGSNFNLVGFATLNGGTTGGAGGPSVTVSNGADLQAAINQGGPRIIYVNGTITESNSSDTKINVKDVSKISIIGVGTNGQFNGIGIKLMRTSNVILRNLKVHNVLIGDKDCISIEGPVNNVWVDHCELYNQFDGVDKDYYDALLDAKSTTSYLTYSWNKLHDSWKASLCGSSESDTNDRRLTSHHNSFININSRLPLYRGGQGHIYNNYYNDVPTSGVNSRINAKLRVENNVFVNVNNPICSLDSDVIGYWDVRNNTFTNCTGNVPTTSTCSYTPSYSYTLESVSTVQSTVTNNAGVGKI